MTRSRSILTDDELIADVPVGDVNGGLQRLAPDIAPPFTPSESRSLLRDRPVS